MNPIKLLQTPTPSSLHPQQKVDSKSNSVGQIGGRRVIPIETKPLIKEDPQISPESTSDTFTPSRKGYYGKLVEINAPLKNNSQPPKTLGPRNDLLQTTVTEKTLQSPVNVPLETTTEKVQKTTVQSPPPKGGNTPPKTIQSKVKEPPQTMTKVQPLPTRPKKIVQPQIPNTKPLQEKTKVLMEKVKSFGSFNEGSTSSYTPGNKEKIVSNAQKMVAILGSKFATKLETTFTPHIGKDAILPSQPMSSGAKKIAMLEGNFFDPNVRAGVMGVQIAKDLASVLVNDKGQLQMDKGVTDIPTDLCHPSILDAPPLSALKHADGFAGQLKNSEEMRSILDNVKAPTSETGKQIVRNVLGLSPNAEVSATDTKRALITAMATELRQGSVGSCFATGVAIGIQKSDPLSMMQDLSQMLSEGKLTRNGVTVPVVQKMNVRTLNVPLNSLDGLAARPDFEAALKQMGITKNPQQAIENAAQGLVGKELTPRNILKNLSATTPGTSQQKAATLNKGLNAFASASQNPLLRSWEYTLATLGSDKINSNNKNKLAGGLFGEYVGVGSNHLGSFLSKHGVNGSELTKAKEAIKNAVQNQFGFRYDADLVIGKSNDGSSESGAFVLQFRSKSGNRADITTKEDYTKALEIVIQNALQQIKPPSKELTNASSELSKNINSIVESTSKVFDKGSEGFAPWKMDGGGHANDTLKGYYGIDKGKGLEETKIEFGERKGNRDGLKFAATLLQAINGLKDKTQSHVSVSSSSHAFNILPTHETVVPLLSKLGKNPEQSIKQHLTSLKQTDAEPKIVLADSNWGGAGENTFLALALKDGKFTLMNYDPASNQLSNLADNLQQFVNETSWDMRTVEFTA